MQTATIVFNRAAMNAPIISSVGWTTARSRRCCGTGLGRVRRSLSWRRGWTRMAGAAFVLATTHSKPKVEPLATYLTYISTLRVTVTFS